jgi:hypothetical protein
VAKIRAAKADDGDIVARCEAAARELAKAKALDTPQPVPAVAAGAAGGDAGDLDF